MIVISDTSPIINLAIIGHLNLLPEIFGKVVIPHAVFEEITVTGEGMPGAKEIQNADWIEVKKCTNQLLLKSLSLVIDRGEAEAICLSIEIKSDLLLIDERLGRRVAKDYELNILGILGLIRQAKIKKLIPQVKPLLDQLIKDAGFRVSKELYNEILKSVDELT